MLLPLKLHPDARLFPLLDPGRHFIARSWLVPAAFTAIVVMTLLAAGSPQVYFYCLALYVSAALYYVVDLLCHRRKPIWVALVIGTATYLLVASDLWRSLLLMPFRSAPLFRDDIDLAALSLPLRYLHFFVAAGLAEEALKALPLLACLLIGLSWHNRLGHWLGIRTPLEGILLGAASGLGFSLFETLSQYVPNLMHQVAARADHGTALYAGLTLLIPRLLGNMFGHMAYSGYFGYFVGLAALRVVPWWKALAVGWVTTAAIHALWDALATTPLGLLAEVGVACLAYASLAAAIQEGRKLVAPGAPTLPAEPG
jgi:RsiW-degrading membrane proteinase PrsW (M82 family)